MNIKETINSFTTPSKRLEKAYLTIIIVIVVLEMFFSFFPQLMVSEPELKHSERFRAEIQDFLKHSSVKKENNKNNFYANSFNPEKYDTINLFGFNPNNTSIDEFLKLGLTEKQSKNIINYREKGGTFYKKSDFARIYTISEEQYQILAPYILLPDKSKFTEYETSETAVKVVELFEFDPNTASYNDFERLGLSEKLIKTIDNYLSKGGSFKTAKDFKKIYGLSENQFEQLYPYIKIKQPEIAANEKPEIVKAKKEVYTAELNSSTVEELIKVKGIGKYSAKKIVEYRKKLGGFVRISQLQEVHGVYENNYKKAKQYLTVNNSKVKKININFADFKELISHPYLEKEDVLKILKLRKKKKKFTDLSQLLEKNTLSKPLFERVKPYLKL